MRIFDLKGKLHDRDVLEVLSYSKYMPTEEKMKQLAEIYETDKEIYVFGYEDNGVIGGVIALRHLRDASFEITGIAVAPFCRNRGIGGKLIAYAADRLKCGEICAETDNDAVDFYRKCGFSVDCLGEKYPGCIRYRCTISYRA